MLDPRSTEDDRKYSHERHKYFSTEKFSDHTSRRRAPVLRSETLLSSHFLFCVDF